MNNNLKALDGLRGLAAFYVLVHHARLALTQPYFNGLSVHPEKYLWYDKIFFYFFSAFKFGHEAVIIFFVLSGFLIHLRYANPNFQLFEFQIFRYLKKRIIRIYPTLIVSFLLCFITDYLIVSFTHNNDVLREYSLSKFLFNFFLVPDAPIWGSNYPIWSLKHEWFFYLIYPLLLWLFHQHKVLPVLVTLILFVAYVFNLKIPFIGAAAYTLTIWLLGASLAFLYQRNLKLLNFIPYFVLLIFAYPFINKEIVNYPWMDLCFGLVTMGIIAILIQQRMPITNRLLNSIAWLGTFSYSLYLLHFPFLTLFKSLVIYNEQQLPYHLWYVISACLIVPILIYMIYYCTERVAINYKKKIV